MKPVNQTITEPGKGNCYTACLASLLEFRLDKVPNFRALYPQQEFNARINDWLERYNLMVLRVRLLDSRGSEVDFPFHALPDGAFCIAGGKSPRWEGGHAVVGTIENGFNFRMLHDPHPSKTGIEKIWTLDFLVPRSPAKVICQFHIID